MTLQAHEISGRVVSDTGEELADVSVYNSSNGRFTYTNLSGYFELDNVDEGDVLLFQILGYEVKEVIIGKDAVNDEIIVTLKPSVVSLDQVVILSKVNVLSEIINVDIQNNPVRSSQELYQRVPGLIIGQHAGGGKAEQIFLRGFDVDHGTDITLSVDGLPINMVSHAHGQGYSDSHFIIPETIENLDFGKGPYYVGKGNFNTAGYIDLQTKKRLKDNKVLLEIGDFNMIRNVNLIRLLDAEEQHAYVATEMILSDGFFESSQNFNRFNIMGRYNFNNLDDQELTLTVSHFQSKWDASGQIPVRAVEQGLISRFGAIDDTEGGYTDRTNILLQHEKDLGAHERITSMAYLSRYGFELYSNFTFFLNDPVNGDQIRQKEERTILGAETRYEFDQHFEDSENELIWEAGLGFRYDDVNGVELSRTRNRRETLSRLSYGDTDETNGYGFVGATYRTDRWTINPGLRFDYFRFDYNDFLAPVYDSKSVDDVFLGPKLNVVYAPNAGTQFYAKSGFGFHSNDARVVVAQTSQQTLPGAFGVDVGTLLRIGDDLIVDAALWGLDLQQEFVYVGDEAVVEPSGRSRRYGFDFGLRYQITEWLYFNTNLNYARARSKDDPKGEDYIPLAPDWVSTGALSFRNLGKFSGGIRYRWVDDRPANEDNSIVAEGYFITDLNVNYTLGPWTLGLIVENLFNTEWNETQFATESRLQFEPGPVEEIHFTPGAPFFFRGQLTWRF
jgi:hypothetical protein